MHFFYDPYELPSLSYVKFQVSHFKRKEIDSEDIFNALERIAIGLEKKDQHSMTR